MFLRCSVFSTNTDSLEQPTDTSVPPGKGCVSSFCSAQQPGHSAAEGGHPGQLCWPSGTSMTSIPHNSYRKPPTCPLKNSLALPNTDTPELVTGNIHISMSCAVDFIPCLSSLREMLSIFMHRGAHQSGAGPQVLWELITKVPNAACISMLPGECASFLQPGPSISVMQG